MKIINMTPHNIKVVLEDGSSIDFPPCGKVLRLTSETVEDASVNGIQTVRSSFTGIAEEPPVEEGVMYIVSGIVLDKAPRHDFIAPDTGPTAVRDDDGNIIGVRRFIRGQRPDYTPTDEQIERGLTDEYWRRFVETKARARQDWLEHQ